jgi:GNAT superfamily N-acetyltransferase
MTRPPSAPPLVVRRASSDDFGFVSQDGYLSERVVLRKLEDGDVFIARLGDEPVGYLRLDRLWSKLPYIELIRVLEPYRRSGIGRALLAHAESEAIARGHGVLYSSSQADEPEPQVWHRHMGFEASGQLDGVNEGGVAEVFFRKVLAPGEDIG